MLEDICCRFSDGTFSFTILFLSVPTGRVEVPGFGAALFLGFLRDSAPDSMPERLGEPERLRAEVAFEEPAAAGGWLDFLGSGLGCLSVAVGTAGVAVGRGVGVEVGGLGAASVAASSAASAFFLSSSFFFSSSLRAAASSSSDSSSCGGLEGYLWWGLKRAYCCGIWVCVGVGLVGIVSLTVHQRLTDLLSVFLFDGF